MKTTKRFIAMTAALTLTACAAMPLSLIANAAGNLTITGVDIANEHTFSAYQIFTGTTVAVTEGGSTVNKLSDLKWGSGITKYKGTTVAEGNTVPSGTVSEVEGLTSDQLRALLTSSAEADKITLAASTSYTASSKVSGSNTSSAIFSNLPDGYYVVEDTTNLDGAKSDANSAWIVQVIAGEAKEIAIKKTQPTVDKEVYDDADGSAEAGWGEAADHAINESFQFKLTATIPADDYIKAYDSYALTFTDTMSSGVTFEGIESVSVGGTTIAATNYTATNSATSEAPASGQAGITWTLAINDVKPLVPDGKTWGTDVIVVEVIYNAHLNENAICSKTGGDSIATNNNKVKLTYSNNPDSTGGGTSNTGETTEDYVWVFAYEVDNTKYHTAATSGNALAGATFKLYTDSNCTSEYPLEWNATAGAYIPSSTSTGVAMESASGTGIFNIKGLDAGTYYLHEETAPEGYNKAADTIITIVATHGENAGGTAGTLTLSTAEGLTNDIVDTKNSTLPSTGGMGTRLFVLGGGAAAALAGIYLVSRKRTKEETEG